MTTTTKKILSVIMSLIMVFSISSISVFAEEETAVTEGYYEQGEYSLHYTVIPAEGEFKGRIMFLHGFLYSGTTWNGMAEIMSAEGYDCYLLDLPNFGYSTREINVTELIDREDLVTDFMETIAPTEEWIVAGHSMGGGVSMNIACENDLQALMLFCPSEIYMQGGSAMGNMIKSPFVSKIFDFIFKLVLSCDFIVKLAVFVTTGDINYARNYDASLLADPLMIEGTGASMLFGGANARNTDLEALVQLDTPTLLVWADGDTIINGTMTSNISNALSNAEIHSVEGSHIVIETHPEALAQLSLEFLSK